ncbi:MAG: hypothetical protein R2844_07990 [Caldilineales bacterium]
MYAGVAGAVEEDLAARAGIPFRPIDSGQVRGVGIVRAARGCSRPARERGRRLRWCASFAPMWCS